MHVVIPLRVLDECEQQRDQRRPGMYAGYPGMGPIAVSRHEDYLEEARRQRLVDWARQGQPRRARLATMRRAVGSTMVALGQRIAGPVCEPAENLSTHPAVHAAR